MKTNLIASILVSTALLMASAAIVVALPGTIGNAQSSNSTLVAFR